ncbi:hypothetical protein JCM21900_006324 [Sporobolomyces salmonicolor]
MQSDPAVVPTRLGSQQSQAGQGGGAPPVRLPPVSVPHDDFLPASFDPGRRQSINSDPFLHAFSAPPDQNGTASESYLNPPPSKLPRRTSIDEASSLLAAPIAAGNRRGIAAGAGGAMIAARSGLPPEHDAGRYGIDPQPGYQFGSSFSTSQPPPTSNAPLHPPYAGPPPSYRFDGGSTQTTSTPLDAPSYFDYSMRRHSLSNNLNADGSPPRQPSDSVGETSASPVPSLKRKTSGGEEEVQQFGDGYYPPHSTYPPSSMVANAPPNPKRRTSSLTFDKMNGLSLSEQQRRESYGAGPISPWEERRDSGGSFGSSGSQSYGMYQQVPSAGGQYDQRGSTPQPQLQHQQHQPPPPPSMGYMRGTPEHPHVYDNQQIGQRGSASRGSYEQEMPDYGRRPSIPGVSQMMQGQTPFYGGSNPPPSAPPSHHPHPPSYPQHSRGLAQPAVMVSSIPPTPAEQDNPHSRTTSAASYGSVGPQWGRNGPPPAHPSRQNSTSSLDPASAYGPGGLGKDTPYSRSPELRVSHKLAERKRRKEMAQLFDDLREALPVDRGLKSSKWEILSKAIDYINSLKTYSHELAMDNQQLRERMNLPSGPNVTPPSLGSPHDYGHPPPGSSHSSATSQPRSGTATSPIGLPPQSQPYPQSHPQPSSRPLSPLSQPPPTPLHQQSFAAQQASALPASHVYGQPQASPPLSHPGGPLGERPGSVHASPRPRVARTASHTSSHASSLGADSETSRGGGMADE